MDWEQIVREMWASEQFTVEQVLTAVCHFCDEIGSLPLCDKVPGEFVELAGMVRFLADRAAERAEQDRAEVERLRAMDAEWQQCFDKDEAEMVQQLAARRVIHRRFRAEVQRQLVTRSRIDGRWVCSRCNKYADAPDQIRHENTCILVIGD